MFVNNAYPKRLPQTTNSREFSCLFVNKIFSIKGAVRKHPFFNFKMTSTTDVESTTTPKIYAAAPLAKNPSYEGTELMSKEIQIGPLQFVTGKDYTYLKMRVDEKQLRIKFRGIPLEPTFSLNPYDTTKVQLAIDVTGDAGFVGWADAWFRSVLSYLNEQCLPELTVELTQLCRNNRLYVQWPHDFKHREKYKAIKTPIGYTQPQDESFTKLNALLNPEKELQFEIDLLCWIRKVDGQKIQAGFTPQLYTIDSCI